MSIDVKMQPISEVSSILRMSKLRARRCSFELKTESIEDTELRIGVKKNISTCKETDETIVVLMVTVTNASNEFEVFVEYEGFFSFADKDSYDESIYKELASKNTAAIMFPYIRSQITLLTSIPGIKCVPRTKLTTTTVRHIMCMRRCM